MRVLPHWVEEAFLITPTIMLIRIKGCQDLFRLSAKRCVNADGTCGSQYSSFWEKETEIEYAGQKLKVWVTIGDSRVVAGDRTFEIMPVTCGETIEDFWCTTFGTPDVSEYIQAIINQHDF